MTGLRMVPLLCALPLLVVGSSSVEYDPVRTYRSEYETNLQKIVRPDGPFIKLVSVCQHENQKQEDMIDCYYGDVLNALTPKWQARLPGNETSWCGRHMMDLNDGKLGSCCRDHRNCSHVFGTHSSYGKMWNDGIFTRFSCHCEKAFYECLKAQKTQSADLIGQTYFNTMRLQCGEPTPPIEHCCVRENPDGTGKCLQYSFDKIQPLDWQWVDTPLY